MPTNETDNFDVDVDVDVDDTKTTTTVAVNINCDDKNELIVSDQNFMSEFPQTSNSIQVINSSDH